MNYTIKITDSNEKAKSIVNMLKELEAEYPFISVYEDISDLSEKMEKELESRYKFVLNNPEIGNTWEEVKNNLLKK
jgi:hypothetical protein